MSLVLLQVSSKFNDNTNSSNQHYKGESNEPDYDEDKEQLEEEMGEITTNQVF
jgi:hypothetical protein